MLDLVCIWDREKDTCQEEIVNDNDFVSEQDEYSSKEVKFLLMAYFVEADDGFAINLDAVCLLQ